MSTNESQVNQISDVFDIITIDMLENFHGKEIATKVIKRYIDDNANSIEYHLANVKFTINPFTVMFNDKVDKSCHVFVTEGTMEGVYLLKYHIIDGKSKISVESDFLDYNNLRSFIANYDIANLKEMNDMIEIINNLSLDITRFF